MKKIFLSILTLGSLLFGSCGDWMEIYPRNEQVTSKFWKSKEDVEAVLSAGYSYLRTATPKMIDWSEVRGASVYAPTNVAKIKFQNFQITSSDAQCDWAIFYQVLNMANSVIKYAPEVQAIDETYLPAYKNAHVTEAYFLRGLALFILVRNFNAVPLLTEPYVDDSAPFQMAKSTEAEVIAQIKKDVETALAIGAREYIEPGTWEEPTKGRATKWALYALMADVCLWSEDYDGCIDYADLLINATSNWRPAFMASSYQWFTMFYPGNSNESIFEINWQSTTFSQLTYSPSSYFNGTATATYEFTQTMGTRLAEDVASSNAVTGNSGVRSWFGAYTEWLVSGETQYRVWKYYGTGTLVETDRRPALDANWIVYRMADVILMKAEALIWKGQSGYQEAIDLIDRVRTRAGVPPLSLTAQSDEKDMLAALFHERDIELAAEGKRWYDLVRYGRSQNYRYKQEFIDIVIENNQTGNPTWLRSVLNNNDAWFLPISESQLEVNPLLVQNPYYGGNK